jgi:purine-binding chemotaxis protein CheW
MNIAEIRKKTKKKKEHGQDSPDAIENLPVAAENLPVPANPETPRESALDVLNLIDEENFYIKYSRKDNKELKEFLCFKLGDEEYAIEITIAREIIKMRDITEVPKTADFIMGIVSIRGVVVPVFDIKKLLNIEDEKISITSKFVLLNHNGETVSICVDGITNIAKISLNEIEATPLNVSGAKQEFIRGVAIIGGRMIRILEIEKILDF